ncbi:MAG: TolC family protein [Nitrospirae bacterium]|nr:TolC family protein [Nitrospirota bacterium]
MVLLKETAAAVVVDKPSSGSEGAVDMLTLEQAISLALKKSPELEVSSQEMNAVEARILQAGLFPNPEIEVEVENFGGSGGFNGFDSSETTVQLSQLIELAGKRSKRRNVASLEHDLAGWDYRARRADVVAEVSKAFVHVLAAQERLSLTQELVRLAREALDTVSERVRAGKVSPVEETRARVTLTTAVIEFERARRILDASRKRLAATWGSTEPSFERVVGQLDVIRPVPSPEELESLISGNPEIARWAVAMEHRRAAMALEYANRVPDVALSIGVRRLMESNDNLLVFGVSIPLPVFNRNQGGVLEAQSRLVQAEKERTAARLRVLSALAGAYQELSVSFMEAVALKRDVLPGAMSAFEAAREGYRQGKFDYLVMLDAQRTLFEVRGKYIDALASYHRAAAEVERLIGMKLDLIKESGKQRHGGDLS